MVRDDDYLKSLIEQNSNIDDIAAVRRMLFLILTIMAELENKIDNNFRMLKADINTLFRER